MSVLGPLAFLQPWLLLALLLLPLIWWLLRATPPAPRRQRFPAIRLLLGLRPPEETPARTPWWLVLLRCAIAALVILAFARPLINPTEGLVAEGQQLLVVVDDGWAAARRWDTHRQALDDLLAEAERASVPVRLLLTAPPADGSAPSLGPLVSATDARGILQALQPKPWPTNRAAAAAALEPLATAGGNWRILWAADGLEDGAAAALGERLASLGQVTLLTESAGNAARLLRPPVSDERAMEILVERADPTVEDAAVVVARRSDGREVTRAVLDLPAGESEGSVRLELPLELRNAIARLSIEGEATAGATLLLDARSARQPVGLVDDGGTSASQPLLTELYYIERALQPFAAVTRGTLEQLLNNPPALLVLPDAVALDDATLDRLIGFVEAGGTLLRIAGPQLAANPDALLPVKLRGGDRTLGGVMTWDRPASLAPFDATRPFAGLAVPEDIVVNRQVLAEPALDLSEKTWARLRDGTPLVTAATRGKGLLVLLHTTGNPSWSNLALSGLFVEMLERVLQAGSGIAAVGEAERLPPQETLDAFGRLQEPAPTVLSLTGAELAAGEVGPLHPPGYYGGENTRVALNLEAAVETLEPLPAIGGVARAGYERSQEIELRPWLLGAALLLALLDLVVALALRGLLLPPSGGWRRGSTAAVALLVVVGFAGDGRAQQGNDSFALMATLDTRLAYVETGDRKVDEISRAGLTGLSRVLQRRTSVEAGPPLGVDLTKDEIVFFPLLYWPVTDTQGPLDASTLKKVNDYLATGGTILFDLRDPAGAGQLSSARDALKRVTEGLRIPPLQPLPPEHVLTKAFYLMQDFPGRYAGGALWVDAVDATVNDGVASVIIGANDWAAAWAVGEDGMPIYAVVPGGEQQRELAYRVGVNLVMYALTGNYKSDQVHVPYILERLGQ